MNYEKVKAHVDSIKGPFWFYGKVNPKSLTYPYGTLKVIDIDIWIPKSSITNMGTLINHTWHSGDYYDDRIYVTRSFVHAMLHSYKHPVRTSKFDTTEVQVRALTFLNALNKEPKEPEILAPPTSLPDF